MMEHRGRRNLAERRRNGRPRRTAPSSSSSSHGSNTTLHPHRDTNNSVVQDSSQPVSSTQVEIRRRAEPGPRIGLPGLLFHAHRNQSFRWLEHTRRCTIEVCVAAIPVQPRMRSVTGRLRKLRRHAKGDLLSDTEIGRSLSTHAERAVYAIVTGGHRLVTRNDWGPCNHGSPALMLLESVWPTKRSVRIAPANFHRLSRIGYDPNGGSVATAVYGVSGVDMFKGGIELSSNFRCDGYRAIAVKDSDLNAPLTFVATVCNAGHLSVTVGDYQSGIRYSRLSPIQAPHRADFKTDVTCVRWGDSTRSILHFLSYYNNPANIGATQRHVSRGRVVETECFSNESPSLLVGFGCGTVLLHLCDVPQDGYSRADFIFMEPECQKMARAAVCDMFLVGTVLYVSRLANVKRNLVAYDLLSGDAGPVAVFHGHVNSRHYLKFDVAGGILAAGGDDRCVRLWDARHGGWPLATMRFQDVVDELRIGTTDKRDSGWTGGLWVKSSSKSYICGLVANSSRS